MRLVYPLCTTQSDSKLILAALGFGGVLSETIQAMVDDPLPRDMKKAINLLRVDLGPS